MYKIKAIEEYFKTLDGSSLSKWAYLEQLVRTATEQMLNNAPKWEHIRSYYQLTSYFNYQLLSQNPHLVEFVNSTIIKLYGQDQTLLYWLSFHGLIQISELGIVNSELETLISVTKTYMVEIRKVFTDEVLKRSIEVV
jgi:hypothetical protein